MDPQSVADGEVRYGNALVKRPLGHGGMGEVFLAFHEGLSIPVAVKLLPEAFRDTELIDRFLREAQVCARLDHPHIIRVYDVGRAHGRVYMVMEYVEGEDLERYASDRDGRLPLMEAFRVVGEAAQAVAYAHAQGVVHRDLKPANLMRRSKDGLVKVLDFGLARAMALDQITDHSAVMGTLPYMAPEQMLGRSGPPADVYALGVTLYRLIAGRVPCLGTMEDMLRYHREGSPAPLSTYRPTPARIEALVTRLLARVPEERPTAAEAAERIQEVLRAMVADSGMRPEAAKELDAAGSLAEAVLGKDLGPEAAPTVVPPSHAAAVTAVRHALPKRRSLRPALAVAALVAAALLAWRVPWRHPLDSGPAAPRSGQAPPSVGKPSIEVAAAVLISPDGGRSFGKKDLQERKLTGSAASEFGSCEVQSGEGLRFVLRTEAPLHVYIFNADTSGELICLYPDFYAVQHAKLVQRKEVEGPPPGNPLTPVSGAIVIPPVLPNPQGERMARWFTGDESEGKEWFLVVASREPIAELDALRAAADLSKRAGELKALAARWTRERGTPAEPGVELGMDMLQHERLVPPGLAVERGPGRVVWTCEMDHKR